MSLKSPIGMACLSITRPARRVGIRACASEPDGAGSCLGGAGRDVNFTPTWELTICGLRAGEARNAQRACFVGISHYQRN